MTVNDVVTIVVTVAITVLVFALVLASDDNRKAFLQECQDNHNAHYVCVAMWRGGGTGYRLPLDVN
jgi:hypothetical protein